MAFVQNAATGIVGYETTPTGLLSRGTINAVPPAGLDTTTLTYAPGCVITDLSTSIIWSNVGTSASPSWLPISNSLNADPKFVQYLQTNISSANITGTSAGQLGHAQGVILVPAAPTGYVNVLDGVTMSYTFATAAYTGGGNTTVNIGGGGAALTGLVSAANGIGKASSNVTQFVPLATAGIGLTSAQSINLVAASAFTQPGTAAGTIKCHVWYSQVPL
jgi:hypothetical protein